MRTRTGSGLRQPGFSRPTREAPTEINGLMPRISTTALNTELDTAIPTPEFRSHFRNHRKIPDRILPNHSPQLARLEIGAISGTKATAHAVAFVFVTLLFGYFYG